MPSSSTWPPRVLAGAVSATLLVSGCQTLDGTSGVLSRSDLVNDLATRLESASALIYSADYQLADGTTGSIAQAQQPRRAAYRYPGGKIMLSTDATARCATTQTRTTCTLEPPPRPDRRPPIASVAEASRAGLATPPVVISLLTATALDQEAVVEQEDTTLAGRHATCVRVTKVSNAPASDFSACVTSEGILGSFRGTVDGKKLDTALSDYRDGVDGDAFDLPPGAEVVDRRAGGN